MNQTLIGIVLIIIAVFLAVRTSRTKKLVIVNKRCESFIQYVKERDQSKDLQRIFKVPFNIEAINKWNDFIGTTIDGGKEVAVCTDGEINEIMHVVIHELAHVARNDIEHDDAFWTVQTKLRNYAIDGGFYNNINGTKKFCGKYVGDR